MIEHLQCALDAVRAVPFGTEWNEREQYGLAVLNQQINSGAAVEVEKDAFFLGGDLLRPYVSVWDDDDLLIVSRERFGLSRPRLLEEIESGKYGLARQTPLPGLGSDHLALILTGSRFLYERLAVPRVYLTSLTNASRYRTHRYPLNVSRLAQWLRFRHAARARAVDLGLTFKGDLHRLAEDIHNFAPAIIGVSLNFGEMDSLRELVGILRTLDLPLPILCIGNVLAAWASEEVRTLCAGFELHISASYGENDLERVCASLVHSKSNGSPTWNDSINASEEPLSRYPQSIVLPDDHLFEQTVASGGQISIETSFGCQYGRCSFCPRDHRSLGWRRPAIQDAVAVIDSIASELTNTRSRLSRVLSIVDEDAFGSEGLDPRRIEPSLARLIRSSSAHGVPCEIYTRAEQLFNCNWKKSDSVSRLRLLSAMQPWLSRVFIGVESGSNGQLERFSKGQTVNDVIYALRAGSLLNLPLEFGFITFDPLLTEEELIENICFLARTDVLLSPTRPIPEEAVYEAVLNGGATLGGHTPVFTRVAYMSTELEMFASGPYAQAFRVNYPELIGSYDASFARHDFKYRNPKIGSIASWCRVWTEGTFVPIYRLRLLSRNNPSSSSAYQSLIGRYRGASFALLAAMASSLSLNSMQQINEVLGELAAVVIPRIKSCEVSLTTLQELWDWVVHGSDVVKTEEAEFTLNRLERRRDT